MAYLGCYPIVPLKNQNQSGPYVEYGTVASIDANGVGRIASATIGDSVIFSVRGACHAVVKGGKARFESLVGKGAHAPAIGLEVAFIAGYDKSGDNTAIAEVWCSKTSWEKARAEARGPELVVEAPVKPNSHGAKRIERSAKSGRPVSKVVPFPKGEAVAASSEEFAVAN